MPAALLGIAAATSGTWSECAECSDRDLGACGSSAACCGFAAARGGGAERAGFYARVMERIESQGAASIWSLFFDSPVGRGLAMASMVLALSLGVYLVSSEHGAASQASRAMTGPSFSAELRRDADGFSGPRCGLGESGHLPGAIDR